MSATLSSVEYRDVCIAPAGKKGMGVFTKRAFKKGETVVVGKCVSESSERTIYTIQTDRDVHVMMDEPRSEEHTSELQSLTNLVCRLLLEKKKKKNTKQKINNNNNTTKKTTAG